VALLVAAIILIFVAVCRAGGLHKRLRTRGQALLEQGVESMNVFCQRAIGPGGEKFTPLVATVFTFVLVSNLMGVLPTVFQRGHEKGSVLHLLPAPTSNLSMTLALALVVFVVVQAVGIRENGIGGHIKHFAGPIPALSPLLFPLEIIGALAKPLSLSIRLFGNVFGEETVIAVLVGLAAVSLPAFLPIPFQFPMLAFGVFGSLVQAGVFTILTCAYISLSIGEHDDHGHGAEHDDVKDEFGAHVPAH
jgi:F-type H+-transporting ATPase subunit a